MGFFKKNKSTLNYILFEVTQKCNLNCNFCYNHWKADATAKKAEASFDESIKTLKSLFKNNDIKHVTFTGGEPLLYKRLEELVLFCRMKGASVSLITNGNTGNAELFSNMIRVGVRLFELPFHSTEASVHDRMTGVIGSWEKSITTIRQILNMGGYLVPVIVITKYNFNKIGETLKQLNNLGLSRVMINRYNIGGFSVHNLEKVLPSLEELNEAFHQASGTAHALKMTISSNVCTPHCVVDPKHYPFVTFTNCSMDVSKRPITLTPHGDVRFCNHSPSVMGNIHKKQLQKIFEEWIVQNPVHRPEYCLKCQIYDQCMGGCRAAAEQNGKTFNDVDPLVELNPEHHKTKSA